MVDINSASHADIKQNVSKIKILGVGEGYNIGIKGLKKHLKKEEELYKMMLCLGESTAFLFLLNDCMFFV